MKSLALLVDARPDIHRRDAVIQTHVLKRAGAGDNAEGHSSADQAVHGLQLHPSLHAQVKLRHPVTLQQMLTDV